MYSLVTLVYLKCYNSGCMCDNLILSTHDEHLVLALKLGVTSIEALIHFILPFINNHPKGRKLESVGAWCLLSSDHLCREECHHEVEPNENLAQCRVRIQKVMV
jgi:hypothetical protein